MALLGVALVAACSGSETGGDATTSTGSGTPSGCLDYVDAKTGVSFKDDVIPIFQLSCNFSACHGSTSSSPQEGLALGLGNSDPMSDAEIKEVYDGLVGVDASRSSLPLVTKGDPGKSWLLAKVSYSSFASCDAVKNACSAKGCGSRMPQQPLEADAIATIAGWIKEGAENN
ncbi:MAG: hypothetical protein FJ096_13455 [Deltaproteobacteria bacterium]|nr:hypothetical protein [Deltaproteobacteria bacterium]